jgi:hypothetical protein
MFENTNSSMAGMNVNATPFVASSAAVAAAAAVAASHNSAGSLSHNSSFHLDNSRSVSGSHMLGFPTPAPVSYFDFQDGSMHDDGGYGLPNNVMRGNNSPLGAFVGAGNHNKADSFLLPSSAFASNLDPNAAPFGGVSMLDPYSSVTASGSRFFMQSQDNSPSSSRSFMEQSSLPLPTVDDLVGDSNHPSEQVVEAVVGEDSSTA